jgi:Lon protease-like protein
MNDSIPITEPLERVEHLKELPICITSAQVLLPFVRNHELKINKAAQLRLLSDAVHSEDKMFGVSYLAPDKNAATERPPIGDTGCVAEIRSVKLAKGGGKIAKIFGIARYRILEYVETENPYPLAAVEYFKDEPEDDEANAESALALAQRMKQVMDKTAASLNVKTDFPVLNFPPTMFSFILPELFNFDTDVRLAFLNLRSTAERLKKCQEELEEFEAGADSVIARKEFLGNISANLYKPH